MRGSRSFARSSKNYQRGRQRFLSSGKAILIVTEGEKTEPFYLKELRNRFQLASTDIEIVHPEGTDPLTLTQKAIELREKRKRKAKKEEFTVEYDEVWVVFDLEKPHDIRREQAQQAMNLPKAKAAGIRFAYSDPCFEYWLLLHEEYTTAPFLDCESVIKKLKKHQKDYRKRQSPTSAFLEKVPTAVTNAKRCRKHHQIAGGDGNPSTEIDRLVRSLNSATRLHLQYEFSPE